MKIIARLRSLRFLREEKAQGALEYMLLVGGIIVAAVVVFALYKRTVTTQSQAVEQQANKSMTCMFYNQSACNNDPNCYWDSASQACLPI